jgi:transmembrane sensor
MVSKRIKNIIVKYLTNQATSFELDELETWIKDPNNEKIFNTYVKTNYVIEYNMRKFNSDKVNDKLLEAIANEKKIIKLKRTHRIFRYAAAAAIFGILTTTYFFKDELFNTSKETTSTIVNTEVVDIEPGTNKAILTLENGSQITLEKGKSIQTPNAISNGEEITYDSDNIDAEEVVYNYLTIPRGGQFQVVLEDGTEVWLNSESKLKYPVRFKEGETRKVELIYGEAYFVVSPSTNHQGAKFKVFNNAQEVEVIGTQFNIKAYKDENSIRTTLVEGKVNVSIENRKQSLVPNQQLILNTISNTTSIQDVDVYNEIAWKDGVFSFDEKSLEEIMTVLSRWYDIEVVFKTKSIEKLEFVGILRKNQSIEAILNSIKNFGGIKNYTIIGKKIILE